MPGTVLFAMVQLASVAVACIIIGGWQLVYSRRMTRSSRSSDPRVASRHRRSLLLFVELYVLLYIAALYLVLVTARPFTADIESRWLLACLIMLIIWPIFSVTIDVYITRGRR